MKKNNLNISQRLAVWFDSQWQEVVHAIGITLLAIVLARFIGYDIMSLLSFTPKNKAADFQMSDIYQSVAERKAVHRLSKDITIVSIDGLGREEVVEAINNISDYEPAAIGVDIFFPSPEEDNAKLLNALSLNHNIVCAGWFKQDDGKNTYHHIPKSFFEKDVNVTYGYVNLYANSPRDIIREFLPYVLTNIGDTLLSMPAQLAQLSSPKQYGKLISRGGKVEPIAFDNFEFPVIHATEFNEMTLDALTDKVVLIGDTGEVKDLYITPLREPMAGIKLHAYALQTVLSNNYINSTPTWFNWLIAIVLCFMFAICNIVAKKHMSNVGNLFVRIVQFVMIYVLMVAGTSYFARYHSYVDFSSSILMIGFGAVAFDVWFGGYALYIFIRNKILKI